MFRMFWQQYETPQCQVVKLKICCFALLQAPQYERLLKQLREREMDRFGDNCPTVPVDIDDVSGTWPGGRAGMNMKEADTKYCNCAWYYAHDKLPRLLSCLSLCLLYNACTHVQASTHPTSLNSTNHVTAQPIHPQYATCFEKGP